MGEEGAGCTKSKFGRNFLFESLGGVFDFFVFKFLILIALIFLKNQTKPLVRLAKAAEKFGKGDYVNNFRPSGAAELRKAAYEFDKMAKELTVI